MTLSYAEISRFALKSDLPLTSFSQSVCSRMLVIIALVLIPGNAGEHGPILHVMSVNDGIVIGKVGLVLDIQERAAVAVLGPVCQVLMGTTFRSIQVLFRVFLRNVCLTALIPINLPGAGRGGAALRIILSATPLCNIQILKRAGTSGGRDCLNGCVMPLINCFE